MNTVSIAMATFNGARFVREQLDSVAAQSRAPDELVVTDDASTDDTVAIVRDFARAAAFRVRVESNPRQIGFCRNFERALSLTSGDVIFFSDQDDRWLPDKLATMLGALDATPAALVAICDQHLADGNMQMSGKTILGNVTAMGLPQSYYGAGCATVIRRGWLDVVLPLVDDRQPPYDSWLHQLATALNVRVVVDRPLQIHRRHDANSSISAASNPAGATVIDYRQTIADRDPVTEWPAMVRAYRQLADRIRDRGRTLNALGVRTGPEAAQRYEAKASSLERRQAVLRLPKLARVPAIARLYLSGAYRQFSWKSAIKDLIR